MPGRSINLALSHRGIEALKKVGIAEELLKCHAIPMYARMIHNPDSTKRAIPYGKKNEVSPSKYVYIYFLLHHLEENNSATSVVVVQ